MGRAGAGAERLVRLRACRRLGRSDRRPAADRRGQLSDLRAALGAADRLQLLQGSPAPAPSRPSRPSLRPGRRSRRDRWAPAAAPCSVIRIALPNRCCFSATRAMSTKAPRLRGSTASAVSSTSSACSSLPAAIRCLAPGAAARPIRQDLVVGALAGDRRGKRKSGKTDEQKTRQGTHQSLHSFDRRLAWSPRAARRKSRRSGRGRASAAGPHRPNAPRQWAFPH